MAAINITDRTASVLGAPIYEPTIEQQVVGDAKAKLLANIEDGGSPTVPSRGSGSRAATHGSPAGALSRTATPTRTVEMLGATILSDGQPLYAAVPIETLWVDGDWRAVAPASGDWAATGYQVTNLGPYILFGAR